MERGEMSMPTEVTNALAEFCQDYLSKLAHIGHLPSIFTLKLGRPWQPQALPANVPRGLRRQCYQNAGMLALENRELTYVEGYACPPSLIPVHHAWCIDAEGRVIDNTFDDAANAQYYGVPISRDKLHELVEHAATWGLFAEQITPELLWAALEDVQAGAWPASEPAAEEVRALLRPYLKET